MVLFIQNHAQDSYYGRIFVHFECARPIRGYDCYYGDKNLPAQLVQLSFYDHLMLTTEARTALWSPLRATTTLFGPLL